MTQSINNPKLLFFKTETTEKPTDYDAPCSKVDCWPRLVQLSWIVSIGDYIIKRESHKFSPWGFIIPKTVYNLHPLAITVERGEDIKLIIDSFLTDLADVDGIVGHNIEQEKK